MSTHHTHSADQLRQRRASLIEQARAILNSGDRRAGLSRDAELRFDDLMAQADAIQDEMHHAQLLQPNAQSLRLRAGLAGMHNGRSVEEAHPEKTAFDNYLKFGLAGLNDDDRATMQRRYQADGLPMIHGAQGVGSGGAGGFAVPDEAMAPLVEALKLVGGLLPFATILPSETGADLPIPTDNETAVEGEIVNENSQHNEGDVALAQVVLQSFLYSSKVVRTSIQLMDDAGFDFGAYVMRKLGERIGRITSKHWISGDGASKPRGIVTAASVGKTAASATAVTYDELVDLLHSVDPIYRQNGTWLVSDTTFAAFRKLKDGQSRPLYGDLANSAPNMLLGHRVSIDPNMPSLTTGQKAILFGDLKSYYVRLVKGPRVLRLEERYADFGQLGFLAFLRADGDLVDGGGGAVKALQMA